MSLLHSSTVAHIMFAASFEDVQAAAKRLEGHIHRTPVMTCSTLNEMAGKELYFKVETLQKVPAHPTRMC